MYVPAGALRGISDRWRAAARAGVPGDEHQRGGGEQCLREVRDAPPRRRRRVPAERGGFVLPLAVPLVTASS